MNASISIGVDALRANPLRTLLSTLGVVMGVGAMVSVLAMGDGVEAYARQQIEETTDRLSLPVFDVLEDGELATLFRVLTPLTRLVVAGGDVPAATPMGLDRSDLDNDTL